MRAQAHSGTVRSRREYCRNVRRPLLVLAPIGAAAVLATGGSPAAAQVPIVGCAERAEPSIDRFERQRDVIRGRFALITIQRDLPRLSRARYRPRAGRLPGIKLPVGVHARHEATLRVAGSQRRHVALIYRHETHHAQRVRDGDRAVTFRSCPADTRGFSGGTVGPITGWAGALIMSGPRCVRLEVRVDGERRPDIRLPLGRRCR